MLCSVDRRSHLIFWTVALMACADAGTDTPPNFSRTDPSGELLLDVADDQSFLLYASNWQESTLHGWTYQLFARIPGSLDARLSLETGFASINGGTASWGGILAPLAWWPGLSAPIRTGLNQAWSADGSVAYWDMDSKSLLFAGRAICPTRVCEPMRLVEDVEFPISRLSRDGRWLVFQIGTSSVTTSLSLIDTQAGTTHSLEERPREMGGPIDLGTFAPDLSSVVFESRSNDRPRLRAYRTSDGERIDWPEFSAGWIIDRAFLDARRMIVIFAPRDEAGYVVATVDEQSIHEEVRLPGTSTVWFIADGGILLEIGGDLSDLNQARVFNFRAPGSAPITLERFGRLADVTPDGSRIAFFEDTSGFFEIATLAVVSMPDGVRDTIPGVPTDLFGGAFLGESVALHGEALIYLDQIGESGGGTLHVRLRGEDQIIATGVANFRVADNPANVYYTVLADGADSPFDGGRIETTRLPE